MRVFLAGASGVIGVRLVPLLVADGHVVAGMTRTPEKADPLRSLGADPVVCDVYDADALRDAVVAFRADAIVDLLSDLPDDEDSIPRFEAANARMRRDGTRNLLAAARACGTSRFVAQSVAWELGGDAGEAVREHEQTVLEAGGVVLRYGQFFGPGTYFEDEEPTPPRIHVDEAARRTVPALDAAPGVILVADA
ncbi:MAG: NAD-dependent epimerase/dehydratase family protein [Actinomycetota bacterium]